MVRVGTTKTGVEVGGGSAFFAEMGFEEGGIGADDVKNMPGGENPTNR